MIIACVQCFATLKVTYEQCQQRKIMVQLISTIPFIWSFLFEEIDGLKRKLHVPVFFIYETPITVRCKLIQRRTVCGLSRGEENSTLLLSIFFILLCIHNLRI